MNSGKEGNIKRKKGNASNTFDKALAAMIKTLNACHFDQALIEQAMYCEPLINQIPNYQLKMCFGFHYGSAIEGAHFALILTSAVAFVLQVCRCRHRRIKFPV